MKKRILAFCLLLALLMPLTAAAAPTASQIDFNSRNYWGSQLAPCGGNIYYLHDSDVYSMSKSGGNKKKLYDMEMFSTSNMQTHNGYVYFENHEKGIIYRFKPGAAKPTAFLSNAASYVIGGDVMYYTDSAMAIKYINLKTGKKGTALAPSTGLSVAPTNFVDGKLAFQYGTENCGYYNPTNGEYRMMPGRLDKAVARGSYIYVYKGDDGYVYRGKLSDSCQITGWNKFLYIGSADVAISGDYIYYMKMDGDENHTLYKQAISGGSAKKMKKYTTLYEPLLQPYGDYIWIFGGLDGAKMGLVNKIGK